MGGPLGGGKEWWCWGPETGVRGEMWMAEGRGGVVGVEEEGG
jgi:hypothetical protein